MRLDEMFLMYAEMHNPGIEDEINQPEEGAWIDRKQWHFSPTMHS